MNRLFKLNVESELVNMKVTVTEKRLNELMKIIKSNQKSSVKRIGVKINIERV